MYRHPSVRLPILSFVISSNVEQFICNMIIIVFIDMQVNCSFAAGRGTTEPLFIWIWKAGLFYLWSCRHSFFNAIKTYKYIQLKHKQHVWINSLSCNNKLHIKFVERQKSHWINYRNKTSGLQEPSTSLPLIPILKIQLPYFITHDKPLKALINHECIIISALTSSLIYSTANLIWYVVTFCTALWGHKKEPQNLSKLSV